MPSPTPFWPQTLVDYAQILAAIATSAAVIVSLWIARRRPMPELRATADIFLLIHAGAQKPFPEYMMFHVTNIGQLEAAITNIGWRINKRWWQRKKKALWAIQDVTSVDRGMSNPTFPTKLTHGGEAKFSLPLQGHQNWLEMIAENGFFKEAVTSRKQLERLRLVVFAPVGKNFYTKPSKQLLDRVWVEQQKFIAAQAAT